MTSPWIIIPSRGGRHWLEECLPSLRATVPMHLPIVVVDNASRDGTAQYLASQHPEVRRLELSRNLGFVQATNLGILLARRNGADSVLLVNNDTRFEPGWFDHFLDAVDSHPETGIFGVLQFDFEGRPSARTRAELARLERRSSQSSLPEVADTDWVEGSCMFVRESVFQKIGYLDPIFAPAYFEEMDFCRRARAHGVRVGLVTTSHIAHFGAGTSRLVRPRRRGRPERRRRVLSELNYLLYHASDPANRPGAAALAARALRHGAKQMLLRNLNPLEWTAAVGKALARRTAIQSKIRRDLQGRACPLVGSGLRGGAKHTHYLDWITLIDASPVVNDEITLSVPPTEIPRASVVIPVRDRTEEIEGCLQRVLGQSLDEGDFEILVCDDGSSPETARRIEAICCRDTRIRYLRQDAKGPAAARNMGVANARAEIVVFTDSDTLPEEGWLRALLVPFADPSVVAVEGPVRTPRPARSALEEAPRNEGGVHLTANMAYRRKTLIQVGGLDEQFPLAAFEDVDLALCASRLGKIAFAGDAVVMHPWRRVTLASSLRRLRQLDWLIVTAQRHGCLGWKHRPTRHPRLRVIRGALLTMPLGRIRRSLALMRHSPADSFARIGITMVEMLMALFHVPRWLKSAHAPLRRRYLHGALR